LLTGPEGVTAAAHFNADFFLRRTRNQVFDSAGADNFGFWKVRRMDIGFHGKLTVGSKLLLRGNRVDVDSSLVLTGVIETNRSVDGSKECVIPAHAHVRASKETSSSLSDQYRSCRYGLAAERFHAQSAPCAVAAVSRCS
jgi:hypothetical protein